MLVVHEDEQIKRTFFNSITHKTGRINSSTTSNIDIDRRKNRKNTGFKGPLRCYETRSIIQCVD